MLDQHARPFRIRPGLQVDRDGALPHRPHTVTAAGRAHIRDRPKREYVRSTNPAGKDAVEASAPRLRWHKIGGSSRPERRRRAGFGQGGRDRPREPLTLSSTTARWVLPRHEKTEGPPLGGPQERPRQVFESCA